MLGRDPRFLAGGHGYLDDITRPGLLHAAFVRSPHAHARTAPSPRHRRRRPSGVVGVFTADDLQGVQPIVTAQPKRRRPGEPVGLATRCASSAT
ncbi:hypothetical protein HBB16_19720 [Pseudonocardia sp. MCCB 268]|nr:hypothetical protein [Pseudonocardia cytotoxica]